MRTASADAGPTVAFRDVVKVYDGRVTALDHVSFEIARGETVALLGPNGAGWPADSARRDSRRRDRAQIRLVY